MLHLTSIFDPEVERGRRETPPGMAHWAGSGPPETKCVDCRHLDLAKDSKIIRAAYNDKQGVTAEFNLNVLRRLNREFGADFELKNFEHDAIYDETRNRIEMRLISTRPQTATLAGTSIVFERDEYIITEYSHKYSVEGFTSMAEEAGLELTRTWTDADKLFSVHYLTVMMNDANDKA